MTRRNNKRNERRERNHNTNRKHSEEQAANIAASMAIGALMGKMFGTLPEPLCQVQEKFESIKHTDDKPFSGIRKVSNNHLETGVIVPADGSAAEIKIPDNLEVFISEDGKPMIRKKVEGNPNVKKEVDEPITYYKLSKDLFLGTKPYYWNVNTDIESETIDTYECNAEFVSLFNCNSEAPVKRLMAFNKLPNIAQYLNKGWKPNFFSSSKKYFIWKCGITGKYTVGYNTDFNEGSVYFKTEDLAKQAIDIMGEQSLADLFNTNW